jgi:hypothetical protein
LTVPQGKDEACALGTARAADRNDVTLVKFALRWAREPRSNGGIPREREQLTLEANAQPVSAFAAHADGGCGLGDALGSRQDLQESKLTLGRPSVASSLAMARLGVAHPPAWITNTML